MYLALLKQLDIGKVVVEATDLLEKLVQEMAAHVI